MLREGPGPSGSGFGREVPFAVDAELALVEPANSPVLYPLLGDLVQGRALRLPIHEMPRALHGESQLVLVLDQTIELRHVLTAAEARVELSSYDQGGNRELGRHLGVPSRQDDLSHSHHTLGRRSFRCADRWRAPRPPKLIVLHDRGPHDVFDAGLPLILAPPTGGADITREHVSPRAESHWSRL